MKRWIATLATTALFASQVYAHDTMYGSGMQPGLQGCPFPYGVPANILNMKDEADDLGRVMNDIKEDMAGIRTKKREAEREVREAEQVIDECFSQKYNLAIKEHLATDNYCSDYDISERSWVSEDECQEVRGTDPRYQDGDPMRRYERKGGSREDSPEDELEKVKCYFGGCKKESPQQAKPTSFLDQIKNFFKKETDIENNQRLPASEMSEAQHKKFVRSICSKTPVMPGKLSGLDWGGTSGLCHPGYNVPGSIPPEVAKMRKFRGESKTNAEKCISAMAKYHREIRTVQIADSNLERKKAEMDKYKGVLSDLQKDFKKEYRDAQTEAIHCPDCVRYQSERAYENQSLPQKIGNWVTALSPLALMGGTAAVNYKLGESYMNNAAQLGYLTGPMPSFASYGFPYLMAGLYGSVAAAVNGGFGCGATMGGLGGWGPYGMMGPYGGAGGFGNFGGAFGAPNFLMGAGLGAGAFMPGMGPWGMASPFGSFNPFGGMGLGFAGAGMLGGGAWPFGGFPNAGFAGGLMGGLGFAGGLMGGVPFGGLLGGGFALGGMPGMFGGLMGAGGFALGGLMGGIPGMFGGLMGAGGLMGGIPGMFGGLMGGPLGGMGGMESMMMMQIQQQMMQQQMMQYQAYMQFAQIQQQRQMAKAQIMSSLNQEMMALQLRIQQVASGYDMGMGMGGIGFAGGIGISGGIAGGFGFASPLPYVSPFGAAGGYAPPMLRPGVGFPGYNGGYLQFQGFTR